MQDTPKRNDDEYVRAGGPYADLLRELVESGRYGSAAEAVLDALALLRDQELLRKAKQDWLKA
jgi:Arc/MetJ-type ribon-helix-helix transcriptional regulator